MEKTIEEYICNLLHQKDEMYEELKEEYLEQGLELSALQNKVDLLMDAFCICYETDSEGEGMFSANRSYVFHSNKKYYDDLVKTFGKGEDNE